MGSEINDQGEAEVKTFAMVSGGAVFLGVVAYGLSLLFKTPFPENFLWRWDHAAMGLAATAPLALFLHWFVNTSNQSFAAFRRSQIEYFAGIGFEFTWPRIIFLSFCAGVFEELLFRGVFQVAADRYMPLAAAIILTNILFGLLHWRTALYALIAGVVGAYLGVLFWLSGNLLTPIITHAVYDCIAMWYTRVAVETYRAEEDAGKLSTDG